MRLIVHALEALNYCLLKFVNHLGALACGRVDLVDSFVMDLNLEVGRPAPITAQPGICLNGRFHESSFYAARLAP